MLGREIVCLIAIQAIPKEHPLPSVVPFDISNVDNASYSKYSKCQREIT